MSSVIKIMASFGQRSDIFACTLFMLLFTVLNLLIGKVNIKPNLDQLIAQLIPEHHNLLLPSKHFKNPDVWYLSSQMNWNHSSSRTFPSHLLRFHLKNSHSLSAFTCPPV